MKGQATVISAILVLVILIAAATYIYQQKQKTEKTFFGTLWDKFFPSQTESIVISGTTVGSGCGTKTVTDVGMLAAAVADCWKKGDGDSLFSSKVLCCYQMDPSQLSATIGEAALTTALTGKSIRFDWSIEANLDKTSKQFTLCFDTSGLSEVFLTRNPPKDCK